MGGVVALRILAGIVFEELRHEMSERLLGKMIGQPEMGFIDLSDMLNGRPNDTSPVNLESFFFVQQDPFEELRNALDEQSTDALNKALEESIATQATNTVDVEFGTQLAMADPIADPITGTGPWPSDGGKTDEIPDIPDIPDLPSFFG